jgi:hypothetical protein
MAVFGMNNNMTELAHRADCASRRFFVRCAPQPTMRIVQVVDLDVLLSSPCQLCRRTVGRFVRMCSSHGSRMTIYWFRVVL